METNGIAAIANTFDGAPFGLFETRYSLLVSIIGDRFGWIYRYRYRRYFHFISFHFILFVYSIRRRYVTGKR